MYITAGIRGLERVNPIQDFWSVPVGKRKAQLNAIFEFSSSERIINLRWENKHKGDLPPDYAVLFKRDDCETDDWRELYMGQDTEKRLRFGSSEMLTPNALYRLRIYALTSGTSRLYWSEPFNATIECDSDNQFRTTPSIFKVIHNTESDSLVIKSSQLFGKIQAQFGNEDDKANGFSNWEILNSRITRNVTEIPIKLLPLLDETSFNKVHIRLVGDNDIVEKSEYVELQSVDSMNVDEEEEEIEGGSVPVHVDDEVVEESVQEGSAPVQVDDEVVEESVPVLNLAIEKDHIFESAQSQDIQVETEITEPIENAECESAESVDISKEIQVRDDLEGSESNVQDDTQQEPDSLQKDDQEPVPELPALNIPHPSDSPTRPDVSPLSPKKLAAQSPEKPKTGKVKLDRSYSGEFTANDTTKDSKDLVSTSKKVINREGIKEEVDSSKTYMDRRKKMSVSWEKKVDASQAILEPAPPPVATASPKRSRAISNLKSKESSHLDESEEGDEGDVDENLYDIPDQPEDSDFEASLSKPKEKAARKKPGPKPKKRKQGESTVATKRQRTKSGNSVAISDNIEVLILDNVAVEEMPALPDIQKLNNPTEPFYYSLPYFSKIDLFHEDAWHTGLVLFYYPTENQTWALYV